MNNTNLINKISAKFSLNKKSCELIFNKIFEGIKTYLKDKKEFCIENFGSFKIVRRKMQKIIDYNKKAVVLLPPKDKLIFVYYNGLEEKESKEKYTHKELHAKELIKEIAAENNLNEIDVYNYYFTLFDIIKDCFKKSTNVNILEFGKFRISGKEKVSFSPAKKFQDEINYNFNNLETVIIRSLNQAEISALKKQKEEVSKKLIEEKYSPSDIMVVDTDVEKLVSEEEIEEEEKVIEDLSEKEEEIQDTTRKYVEEKTKLENIISELKEKIELLERRDEEILLKVDEAIKKIKKPEVIIAEEEEEPILEGAFTPKTTSVLSQSIQKEIEEKETNEFDENVIPIDEGDEEIEIDEDKDLEVDIFREGEVDEEEIKKMIKELEDETSVDEVIEGKENKDEEITEDVIDLDKINEEIKEGKEYNGEESTAEKVLLKEEQQQEIETTLEKITEEKKEESWEESFERKWKELREKIFSSTPTELEDLKQVSLSKEPPVISEKITTEPEEAISETSLEKGSPEQEIKTTEPISVEKTVEPYEEKITKADIKETTQIDEKEISSVYPDIYEDEDTLSISEIYGRLKNSFSFFAQEQQGEKGENFVEEETTPPIKEGDIEKDISLPRIISEETKVIVKEEPTEIVDTSMEDVIRKYEILKERLREELSKEDISYQEELISEKPLIEIGAPVEEKVSSETKETQTIPPVESSPTEIQKTSMIEETKKELEKEPAPLSSIEDLKDRKVEDDIEESIEKTLYEIKSYMDEIAKKEKFPLINGESETQKEPPFDSLNNIEMPKSIDDYFEKSTRNNIKKFPDVPDNSDIEEVNGNNNSDK